MAVAVVDVQVNSRGAVDQLRNINNASRQAQSGIDRLTSSVNGLIKAYAAFQAVKFVFVQTADIESQTRSLQVLTGSVQQAKQIVQELQQLGAATPFTSAELIDAAKRLQAFGVEANKVVETTRRLADVSGATGAELQGLVTAFGQVQAKGRLQGEELLQFQERGVALQKELQRMYRMSGEEFRQSLEKGRFSAEAVEQAVINLTSAGGKYANGAIAQSDTLQGKLSTLQDSFQRLAQNIGTFFAPVFKFLIDRTNELITRLNRGFAGASEEIRQRAAGQKLQNVGVGRTYTDAQGNVYSTITGRLVQSAKTAPKAAGGGAPPALLGATGGSSKGAKDAERAAEAAKRESERVAEILKNRTAEAEFIRLKSGLQDQIAVAEATQDSFLVARLQGQAKQLDLQYQYAQELSREKDLRAQQAIIFEGQTALVANERDIQRELNKLEQEQIQTGNLRLQGLIDEEELLRARLNGNEAELILQRQIQQIMKDTKGLSEADVKNKLQGIEALKKQLEVADQMKQIYEDIGSTIKTGVVEAIQGAIDGTKTLQEVASNVLNNIASKLLDIAVNLALFGVASGTGSGGGLLGALFKKRAMGGNVVAGQPYLVGEKGPELFMPGKSGGIAPAGSFGGVGNIVVNVDATGSSVQGDQAQGKALGALVGAAVQAELIKQKKPGGLLY